MKKENFLKKSKVKNLSKIFLNTASGEAIHHPLNGAIMTSYEQVNVENIKTQEKTTDHLAVINSLEVVINNQQNQGVEREEDFETITVTGANIQEDVIIDVKQKGITQERLFLATRIESLTPEQIKAERERIRRVEENVNYPVSSDESFMPDSDGDENHLFGYNVNAEDIAETEEEEGEEEKVSVLDKRIETQDEAVLFIQEVLGVFDDDDISQLLHRIKGQRVTDAAAEVVSYVKHQSDALQKLQAVNAYKKQLRVFLGINEPSEVVYERH